MRYVLYFIIVIIYLVAGLLFCDILSADCTNFNLTLQFAVCLYAPYEYFMVGASGSPLFHIILHLHDFVKQFVLISCGKPN